MDESMDESIYESTHESTNELTYESAYEPTHFYNPFFKANINSLDINTCVLLWPATKLIYINYFCNVILNNNAIPLRPNSLLQSKPESVYQTPEDW